MADFSISTNVSSSSLCTSELDLEYWTYVSLPVSLSIIVLFSLLEARVRLWPDFCNRRPGIPYPVNLVDSYEDRWSFSSAFAVMSTSILLLFSGQWVYNPNIDHIHNMLRGTVSIFVGLANVLLICAIFYPLLICLRTQHKIIGNIIGLLFNTAWMVYYLMTMIYCQNIEILADRTTIAIIVPVFMGYMFLETRFSSGLYEQLKKAICDRSKRDENEHIEVVDDFKKTHYYERVKHLLTPSKKEGEVTFSRRFRTKFYPDAPGKLFCFQAKIDRGPVIAIVHNILTGFRYSARVICTVVLASLTTYQVGLLYLTNVYKLWMYPAIAFDDNGILYQSFAVFNATEFIIEAREFFQIAEDMFWASCYFAIPLSILYTLHMPLCYREHTLKLWRGNRDFCPKEKFHLPSLVVANLRFSGYAIGFSAWGFLITQVVSWLLLFFVAYFIIHQLQKTDEELTWLLRFVEGYWLTFVMGIVFYYVQVALAHLAFLQKEKEMRRHKVHLSLNNRRMFHVVVYVTLFVNVIVGLVSCLMRIVKAVIFGVLFIGRIDRSILMRGWELWDPGFKSYMGFLELEVAHTHPVLVTFCHFLWKSVGKDMREEKAPLAFWRKAPTKQGTEGSMTIELKRECRQRPRWPRNKWFVAITLMRNRSLTIARMRVAPELLQVKQEIEKERQAKQFSQTGAVSTTVTSNGSDSTLNVDGSKLLIQDVRDTDSMSVLVIKDSPAASGINICSSFFK